MDDIIDNVTVLVLLDMMTPEEQVEYLEQLPKEEHDILVELMEIIKE